MQRHAFKMKLKPGHETEYRRRHDAIWPELAQAIRAAGVTDYSIFLDRDTSTLFAVQLQDDPAAASALAAEEERTAEIVGAYIIAVEGVSPTGREAMRETIRMNGPTIRIDLGKQAEARDERI